MSQNLCLLCLLMLLLAAGCASPTNTPTPAPATVAPAQVQAELDVFSGRPNPQWTLSAEDARRLLDELEKLPQAPAEPFDSLLGYRGILVRVSSAEGVTTYRLWNALVTKEASGQLSAHHDKDRALEEWLLTTGRPYLEEGLYEMVMKEITESPSN